MGNPCGSGRSRFWCLRMALGCCEKIQDVWFQTFCSEISSTIASIGRSFDSGISLKFPTEFFYFFVSDVKTVSMVSHLNAKLSYRVKRGDKDRRAITLTSCFVICFSIDPWLIERFRQALKVLARSVTIVLNADQLVPSCFVQSSLCFVSCSFSSFSSVCCLCSNTASFHGKIGLFN